MNSIHIINYDIRVDLEIHLYKTWTILLYLGSQIDVLITFIIHKDKILKYEI